MPNGTRLHGYNAPAVLPLLNCFVSVTDHHHHHHDHHYHYQVTHKNDVTMPAGVLSRALLSLDMQSLCQMVEICAVADP